MHKYVKQLNTDINIGKQTTKRLLSYYQTSYEEERLGSKVGVIRKKMELNNSPKRKKCVMKYFLFKECIFKTV